MMSIPSWTLAVSFSLSLPAVALAQDSGILVKKGDKIAFLGDSITQSGARATAGYCRLVVAGLAQHGVEAKMIPAGISGHKSNQMLARLERDVLKKQPDWMTLSCGVNDVWHGKRGVPLDQYKKNITEIVTRAQAAGIKVMILTATMIRENPANEQNRQLAPYNMFLRGLAKEKGCLLADLNADMQAALANAKTRPKGNVLTTDGVHMNALGNIMMASGVLKAFGMNDDQLKACREKFEAIPKSCSVRLDMRFTAAEYKKLQERAAEAGVSVRDLFLPVVEKKVSGLLGR